MDSKIPGHRNNLIGANLIGANLCGANMSGADLHGANLNGASLSGANLSGADLRGANLNGANLCGADLSCASLSGADMIGANLSGTNLRGAYLSGANLRGAVGLPESPVVPRPHRQILAAIAAGGQLKMSNWHTCETTHCRAGWLIHLAGAAGQELEDRLGSSVAGSLIALASCPQLGGRVPDWCASNDEALADICRLAALESDE